MSTINIDLTGETLYTGDGTLVSDRLVDCDGKLFFIQNNKQFSLDSSVAPSAGASININGFGTTSSDITHRFGSTLGNTLEMYGDRSAQFKGRIGVGIAPTATAQAYFFTNTLQEAILGEGTNLGFRGVGTNVGVVGQSAGGIGLDGSAPIAIRGIGSTYGIIAIGGTAGGYFYGSAPSAFGVNAYELPSTAGAITSDGRIRSQNLPIYADNAAALGGGLGLDYLYKTATGEIRIVV